MHYYILIRKILEKNNTHFYSVYKNSSEDEINYYIGLDEKLKKIYFYKDLSFQNPFAIYNLETDEMEEHNKKMIHLINFRVVYNAIEALKKDDYPTSLSYEG